MCISLYNLLIVSEASLNWAALSEIILFGLPCRAMNLRIRVRTVGLSCHSSGCIKVDCPRSQACIKANPHLLCLSVHFHEKWPKIVDSDMVNGVDADTLSVGTGGISGILYGPPS